MGDRKRQQGLLVAVALAVALICLPAVASAKTLAKSTFKDSAEKWKVVGDVVGDPEKPNHVDTGGNPGAFIQVEDEAVGGVMFWQAPKEFLGNQRDAYKGSLRFSLTQSASDSQFEDDDVILEGSVQTLTLDLPASPPVFPDWLQVTAPLVPSAGWMDVTVLPATPATGKDLKQVLRHLQNFWVRAEYRTGDDTDGLDSVFLKTP